MKHIGRELGLAAVLTAALFAPSLMAAQTTASAATPAGAEAGRFDMVVRADFFAGFAGDQARLAGKGRVRARSRKTPTMPKRGCGTEQGLG